MKFGEYLRKKREARSWTQPEAAKKADIEQSYLSKLETSKSYPSEDIFSRLVALYDIDLADMSRSVFSAELEKLREIKEVRTTVMARARADSAYVRKWMLAGLAFLMLGGACLGFAMVATDTRSVEYLYRSQGVIAGGEPLTAFDIIKDGGKGTPEDDIRLQEMVDRLNQKDEAAPYFQGDSYVKNVEGGRRLYEFYNMHQMEKPSLLRWFLVPALMFLIGSIGCFVIGFRRP